MKVGKQWRKSSNGPDWTDIRVMMKELMVLHQCQVYLEIMPGTTRDGPQLRIVSTAVSNTPGSDLKVCEEAVSTSWPNNRGLPFDGEVYGLLMRLDARLLDMWWKQEVFTLP
jgi:hypothetical protein